jgi:hypothetical protein
MEQDNHPQASAYLDCHSCVGMMSAAIRARWNCGLLNPKKRTGPGFPVPPSWGADSEVCPGYLITLPQVQETARARVHWEKGLLKERYEGEELTGVLFDCIEILNGAVGDLEMQVSSEARSGNS